MYLAFTNHIPGVGEEGETVEMGGNITGGPRIDIMLPSATYPRRLLQNSETDSPGLEPIGRVHPRESGSDYNHVVIFGSWSITRKRVSHVHIFLVVFYLVANFA